MNVDPIWPMNASGLGSLDELDLNQYRGELKYDGRRGIAVVNDGKVQLLSRAHKSQEGKTPHLEDAFSRVPSGTILDGEFIVLKDGLSGDVVGQHVHIPNFTYTANVMGSKAENAVRKQDELGVKVTFVVFDIPIHGGLDCTDMSFMARRQLLEVVVEDIDSPWVVASQIWEGSELHEVRDAIMPLQAEGLMVKKIHGIYVPGGRDDNWRKFKFRAEYDVVITGFTEGQGKYENRAIGAIKFGQHRDGVLTERGQCGGMNDQIREAMFQNPERFIGQAMTVKAYDPVPGSESFRMPQFKELREDKFPHECTWDTI